MESNENNIEFITGEKTCTVTYTSKKYITKLKKLYEKYPSDFTYFIENEDGSVCAKVPIKWFKGVSIPRQGRELTPEQRIKLAERMRNARASKSLTTDIGLEDDFEPEEDD